MYADIEALNWSSLRHMATSPLLYRWRQDHPREDTPALALGRAVHCAILEPDLYDSRYLVRPEGLDGRTREGKAWLADAGASGREVLTAEQGEVVAACAASVLGHRHAAYLLAGTRREETVTWTAPGGVAAKGRLDACSADRLIDLKTTREIGRFERSAADLLYHGQLAWYRDGAVAAGAVSADAAVYIVAVETSEPYDCGVWLVPGVVLEAGRELYSRLLGIWVECRAAGIWPGRYPGIETYELPPWAAGSVGEGGW